MCGFVGVMGLTCYIYIYIICCCYTTPVVLHDASFYFLVHCAYFRFSKWRFSAILDFDILSKIQISAYFYGDMQNWRLDDSKSSYGVFRIFKMAAVRHIGIGMTSWRTTHDLCLMVLTFSQNCSLIVFNFARYRNFIFGPFGLKLHATIWGVLKNITP